MLLRPNPTNPISSSGAGDDDDNDACGAGYYPGLLGWCEDDVNIYIEREREARDSSVPSHSRPVCCWAFNQHAGLLWKSIIMSSSAPSPPNPSSTSTSTQTDRDTSLSPLSPPPPPLQQQRAANSYPRRNATSVPQQPGIVQRPAQRASDVDVDVDDLVDTYRPSMAGYWVCCVCDGLNNPGLTPERCPICNHAVCATGCKVFIS